jgi:hypothetical protein
VCRLRKSLYALKHALKQWHEKFNRILISAGFVVNDVIPRVTKILIKLLKMQLSLKARADQGVEVANQDLKYQDFKFEVSKCCLVWIDILSQQIFRIDRNRIRSCSQKRSCFP